MTGLVLVEVDKLIGWCWLMFWWLAIDCGGSGYADWVVLVE